MAGVGWLSVNATKSLRAFVERVFANFCDKNVDFTIEGKRAICGCQGTYTYTDTFPKLKCAFKCLNMYALVSSMQTRSFDRLLDV